MKKRCISESLLGMLNNGIYKTVTEIVKVDPYLDMEMRGDDGVMVYYRGGRILTIHETDGLTGLDKEYYPANYVGSLVPNTGNLLEYLSNAKHLIDIHEVNGKKRKLGEKEIQQRVVYENNLSVNAENTDYFIADVEWADNVLGGRADIIAFRWNHMEHRKRQLQFTMIEVKQGDGAIATSETIDKNGNPVPLPGLKKHYDDFLELKKDKEYFNEVALDMLRVIKQKIDLGLVKGLNYLFRNSAGEEVEPKIEDLPDFIFLLANYHHYSTSLSKECKKLPKNSKFYLSSFMGYGLYKDFVFTKDKLQELFPKILALENE